VRHLIEATPLFGAESRKAGNKTDRFRCPKHCRVLLLEQEVGEFDLQKRFGSQLEMLPDNDPRKESLLSNLFVHSCDHSLQLDNPTGVAAIDSVIAEVKPDVVVFDPLIEFHTADENDTQSMTKILRNIDTLRETHKFTTILSHHTRKPSEGFGANSPGTPDRLRGNSALYGKGDAFLMLSVANRNAGIVRIQSTLRRGKPINDFYVKLNKTTLQFEWHGFMTAASKKEVENTKVDDDE
jgi:hypothetical protein